METQETREGYWLPDDYLRSRRGYERLAQCARSEAIIHVCVREYEQWLFDYRDRPHFEVVGGKASVRCWIAATYVNSWPGESGGGAYSLAEWLRGAAHVMCTFGQAFYALDFTHDPAAFARFASPRYLPVETMAAQVDGGLVNGFVQQYSESADDERVRGARFEFSRDEVVWLRWPAELPPFRRGVSPILSVLRDVEHARRYLEWGSLYSYALAHPEDRRFAVERARYRPYAVVSRDNERHTARILARMGARQGAFPPERDTTEYFAAWDLSEFGKRLAILREYLVDEFNVQVLGVWAALNKVSPALKLRTVGYPSQHDWEEAFADYKDGQRTFEEIQDMFLHEAGRPVQDSGSDDRAP